MAFASLKKEESLWASLQKKVQNMTEKTNASVLLLYIPKPTKRNPTPTLKYEGSGNMKSVIDNREVREAITVAVTGPIQKEKSLRESMENIDYLPYTMQAKRFIISNVVHQYMDLKYGLKRDIWGHRELQPEWWPNDVLFVSPNERRNVERRRRRRRFGSNRRLILKKHYSLIEN